MPAPRPAYHPHWWTDVHRSPAANWRLGMVLCAVAGATNAGGFLAVGQYTSHMTGLISAMADHLILGQFGLVLAALAGVAAFVGGAMTTALMVNWSLRRHLRSAYARPLILEAVLLLVFGFAGSRLQSHAEFNTPLTVLLLCYLMGLQNAVITKISNAEIRTTHVTGLVTDIGIELGKMVYINRSRVPSRVVANRRKLRVQSSLVAAFTAGAIAGAWGFAHSGFITSLPLAGVLCLVASGPLWYDLRQGQIAPPASAD